MNQLLTIGHEVTGESSNLSYEIEQFLGGGGQGEVYSAGPADRRVAVKWYFPGSATSDQRTALDVLVSAGSPSPCFLWPTELVSAPNVPGFGYAMELREPRFKGIVDLMKGRAKPDSRALATAGLQLADSYFQLHAKGLCYRDISFGNVFFDPSNGDIRICDNDNVAVNGATTGGVLGTPRFMAPEVVRGDALPSTQTDLYSLAVLLFYMFVLHHPLEGRRESSIRCLDLPAMNKLYGTDPLFIFDPADDSNAPDPRFHRNAVDCWPVLPTFLRDLFTRSFTEGIQDPDHGRVRETEWRAAFARLRDSIIYCPRCGADNFYDLDAVKAGSAATKCWAADCGTPLVYPPRIRIGRHVVMLNHDAKLYPHHLDVEQPHVLNIPLAEVARHPSNPDIWGLKNLSDSDWVAIGSDGIMREVPPGRSVTLSVGTKIQFGLVDGEIRM